VWLAVVIHAVVGYIAWKKLSPLPLVPALNLLVALAVVAYWAQRWVGYLTKGITWYATDQALPVTALLVCVMSLLSITGRLTAAWPNWVVLTIDALILTAAACYFTFFRMNRLI
jgi:hypothetical protein